MKFIGSIVDSTRIPCINFPLQHQQTAQIGKLKLTGLLSPCHTRGHMLFLIQGRGSPPLLFTGDTLFTGGCGKFFEGNADDMFRCFDMIKQLPRETLIFPGHGKEKKDYFIFQMQTA